MKIEAWCVRCKLAREIAEPLMVTMKNGRNAAKGKCSECGTVLYKILSKECVEKLGEEKQSSARLDAERLGAKHTDV